LTGSSGVYPRILRDDFPGDTPPVGDLDIAAEPIAGAIDKVFSLRPEPAVGYTVAMLSHVDAVHRVREDTRVFADLWVVGVIFP
jgi:hypothetical protein